MFIISCSDDQSDGFCYHICLQHLTTCSWNPEHIPPNWDQVHTDDQRHCAYFRNRSNGCCYFHLEPQVTNFLIKKHELLLYSHFSAVFITPKVVRVAAYKNTHGEVSKNLLCRFRRSKIVRSICLKLIFSSVPSVGRLIYENSRHSGFRFLFGVDFESELVLQIILSQRPSNPWMLAIHSYFNRVGKHDYCILALSLL